MPLAQSPWAMDRKILTYLLLGFMLHASDQTQHFISSITDDRVKCRMWRCRCQKVQRGKDSSTSMFGLTTIENKCLFPILWSRLSFMCLIFVCYYLHVSRDFCLGCRKRKKNTGIENMLLMVNSASLLNQDIKSTLLKSCTVIVLFDNYPLEIID